MWSQSCRTSKPRTTNSGAKNTRSAFLPSQQPVAGSFGPRQSGSTDVKSNMQCCMVLGVAVSIVVVVVVVLLLLLLVRPLLPLAGVVLRCGAGTVDVNVGHVSVTSVTQCCTPVLGLALQIAWSSCGACPCYVLCCRRRCRCGSLKLNCER